MNIEITIKGRTPLLMHRFTDAEAMAATEGTRTAMSAERDTPQGQAEACLYRSAQDDSIIIPQPNLLRCFIDAGKFHKSGKIKVTTIKSSLISAAVSMDQIEYQLKHEQPWKVDTRAVRIPATGGRILRHRPCFDDWELSFVVTLDVMTIPEKLFRLVVNDAGHKIGLGDFRPDCKGPFGKFDVTRWQINNGG